MLCEECNKNQATVRLVIAVVDGKKTERHLCKACMDKLQLRAAGIQNMLSAIWSVANKQAEKHPGLTCSKCGMAYDTFLSTSRLGCAQCYQDFRPQLQPLLFRLHGRSQHAGRVPRKVEETVRESGREEQLRREMELAVACEDFEQAAALRDELRALAAAGKGGNQDA